MSILMQIQDFVQEYAETISDVIELDVTIVNEECIRVAGTGPHKESLWQKVPHGSFYRSVLQSGKPGIIEDMKTAFSCSNCALSGLCKELATIAFPLFLSDLPIGIIGISAFSENQKSKLINTSPELWSFLKHMSNLLESKLLLLEQNQYLQDRVKEAVIAVNHQDAFGKILGGDIRFREVLEKARQVAPGTSTVLIRGESGTGKEMLARAIHCESRRQGLFIAIDCASIPENLLESELFGYEAGAFTGANPKGKPGKIELAQGGTVFLDEIGDMSHALQPKLLRVLQERVIDRIGGKKSVAVDVRIIAATNCNLESAIATGEFREDLYYRLNVIPLYLPPLRSRNVDIPLYVHHFIIKYNRILYKDIRRVEAPLMKWMKEYHWPGNIRQLENVIEYMVNMCTDSTLSFKELPEQFHLNNNTEIDSDNLTLAEYLEDYEKKLLSERISIGITTEAKSKIASQLGISLATLYRKLDKYKLNH
ncbi:MAG: hypothetical protein APF84_09605 [Gracilibacter sp. BRH_c7a]|nr:MAG: hypothetical protein APF84_09605 [Gracilibacter sp. BRH_c7a]